uniref:Uncharacterized protein n=1 Tax=Arundo donax TaxID=35708 RepID=A0A0A9GCW2_ARUDO
MVPSLELSWRGAKMHKL